MAACRRPRPRHRGPNTVRTRAPSTAFPRTASYPTCSRPWTAPASRAAGTARTVSAPIVADVLDEVLAGGFARRLGTERIETTDRGRAAVAAGRSRRGMAEDRTFADEPERPARRRAHRPRGDRPSSPSARAEASVQRLPADPEQDVGGERARVWSAHGEANLFGRWRDYAATGHGGNELLRRRNPATLRFSASERASPDTDPAEVVRPEASWKKRLHARSPSEPSDDRSGHRPTMFDLSGSAARTAARRPSTTR